jgi:hypothetical protein
MGFQISIENVELFLQIKDIENDRPSRINVLHSILISTKRIRPRLSCPVLFA